MSLTISLQFPAGRYAAASWTDEKVVEWPPHPARICLALVDVLHKAGDPADLRSALKSLCAFGPPIIVIPNEEEAPQLAMDGFFVPQNPAVATAGIKHARKARSFPSICLDPDEPTIFFHWPEANLEKTSYLSLGQLLSSLPRFGTSHSLVIARCHNEPPPKGDGWRTLHPVNAEAGTSPDFNLRVNFAGLLESAEESFQAVARAKEMAVLIARSDKGANPSKALKPAASPRGRHDARRVWQGYVEHRDHDIPGPPWDHRILVLRQRGDRLGLVSTWQLTTTLHQALLDRWERVHGADTIPPWLSGHRGGDTRDRTQPARCSHLAAFPLPFVGDTHASGHLLGLGLAIPDAEQLGIDRATFRLEWRKALGALFDEDGTLHLTPKDKSWAIQLSPEDSPDPRLALRPRRWTRPARLWHSVTPVILDRHPKPHFKKDPVAWAESCRAIITKSCLRLGLPEPAEIHASLHSPLRGVPPSFRFEAPRPRPGRPPRFHIHASLSFAEPVRGPLLLGAGRYRGYGLFAPHSTSQS